MFRIRPSQSLLSVGDRFAAATRGLEDDIRQTVRSLSQKYLNYARGEARGGPFGTIARQTNVQVSGKGFRTEVGRIARFHLEGTGIYGPLRQVIRPKRARALRFTAGGRTVFAKYVRGVTPDDYLSRAHDKWRPDAQRELNSLAEKFVGRL